MKLAVDNLILEVTRRCNMACAHCMRGDAQNKDMTREIIDRVLENISSVCDITFTGGEPSLNVDIINYTLEKCKQLRIPVLEFYIVTNGKVVTEDFLIACLRWHAYVIEHSIEPETSGVALSRDKFHEPIPNENIALLRTLACFRPDDKHTNFDKYGVLALGRGAFLADTPVNEYRHPTRPDNFIMEMDDNEVRVERMTVTVDGDILSDCDYAYDDTAKLTVGHITDPDWLQKHIAKYESDDDVETQMFHVKHDET